MKKIITSVLILSAFPLIAQTNSIRCGADNHYQEHLNNHPEVVEERSKLETFIANYGHYLRTNRNIKGKQLEAILLIKQKILIQMMQLSLNHKRINQLAHIRIAVLGISTKKNRRVEIFHGMSSLLKCK